MNRNEHLLTSRSKYRRPLGDPAPAVANLALAIVILVVIIVQTAFNAWQGRYLSRLPLKLLLRDILASL